MGELATDRPVLPAGRAPAGLGLVQELINTSIRLPRQVPDLLATEQDANRWLTAALGRWASITEQQAPDLQLTEADLAPLRRLREAMRDFAGARSEHGPQPSQLRGTSVTIGIDEAGRVTYGTTATGWRAVATLIAAELLLAQHAGTWRRLRTCPHPGCGVAFFDESRNNSRVWHDVRTCGNRSNLATSRARRRGTADTATPVDPTPPAT